jgi:hypothetical protein
MTPIEELQAAHERLNEMKRGAQPGPWQHKGDYILRDGHRSLIATGLGTKNVDLIETLHRTIDAQLALIASAIHMRVWGAELDLQEPVIALARAINGENP